MTNILRAVSILGMAVVLGLSGCATTSSKTRGPASEREASDTFSSILMAGGGVALVGAAMSCGMAYRTLTADAEELKAAQVYKQLDELIDAQLKDGIPNDGRFAELLAARQELADAVRRGDLTLDELKQLGKNVESCFVH